MKQLSRQDQLDISIIRDSGNIYHTILELSARAYRLRKGAPPRIKDNSDPFNSGVVTALLERQTGVY